MADQVPRMATRRDLRRLSESRKFAAARRGSIDREGGVEVVDVLVVGEIAVKKRVEGKARTSPLLGVSESLYRVVAPLTFTFITNVLRLGQYAHYLAISNLMN